MMSSSRVALSRRDNASISTFAGFEPPSCARAAFSRGPRYRKQRYKPALYGIEAARLELGARQCSISPFRRETAMGAGIGFASARRHRCPRRSSRCRRRASLLKHPSVLVLGPRPGSARSIRPLRLFARRVPRGAASLAARRVLLEVRLRFGCGFTRCAPLLSRPPPRCVARPCARHPRSMLLRVCGLSEAGAQLLPIHVRAATACASRAVLSAHAGPQSVLQAVLRATEATGKHPQVSRCAL